MNVRDHNVMAYQTTAGCTTETEARIAFARTLQPDFTDSGARIELATAITELDSNDPSRPLESCRFGAISRLAFASKIHPDLSRTESEARASLAAAIMILDEAEDTAATRDAHTVNEQLEVERRMRLYGQSLADLIRGEASS